ncbi:hypothetical protein Tco_1387164 [Tanacetum coccineum]
MRDLDKKSLYPNKGGKSSKPESTLDDSTVFDDQDVDHGMEYMETEGCKFQSQNEGIEDGMIYYNDAKINDDDVEDDDDDHRCNFGSSLTFGSALEVQLRRSKTEGSDLEVQLWEGLKPEGFSSTQGSVQRNPTSNSYT